MESLDQLATKAKWESQVHEEREDLQEPLEHREIEDLLVREEREVKMVSQATLEDWAVPELRERPETQDLEERLVHLEDMVTQVFTVNLALRDVMAKMVIQDCQVIMEFKDHRVLVVRLVQQVFQELLVIVVRWELLVPMVLMDSRDPPESQVLWAQLDHQDFQEHLVLTP